MKNIKTVLLGIITCELVIILGMIIASYIYVVMI